MFSPDDDDDTVVVVAPKKRRSPSRQGKGLPRYNVVLWDSDGHTFDYVEKMLRELFGHEQQQCHELAKTVDAEGRAIVLTTTKEHAELKRDQVHAYGKDHIEGSKGSMWSTVEHAG
ncbi:MAG: ATP-dependent Clp protease adaptor ClpS [Pirellulales bacterium]|nr:ATP-dependent Clp protease adaptor ClpS [Pirellulales bacterium]